jgi:hypothetical protein
MEKKDQGLDFLAEKGYRGIWLSSNFMEVS